jgi:NADH-quinone oxidoreductase subunit E
MTKENQCCCCEEPNLLEQHPEKAQELDAYIDTLPECETMDRRRGLLIQCLHKAQSIFGYLPQEVQERVADKLRLQLADVYGVVSFYSFFTDVPVGKYKVNVCTGTACFVRGADKILKEFRDQLRLEAGETSDDLKFSLGGLRCVGACSLAPVVMVNERVYGNVTPKMVKDIIKDCE